VSEVRYTGPRPIQHPWKTHATFRTLQARAALHSPAH